MNDKMLSESKSYKIVLVINSTKRFRNNMVSLNITRN